MAVGRRPSGGHRDRRGEVSGPPTPVTGSRTPPCTCTAVWASIWTIPLHRYFVPLAAKRIDSPSALPPTTPHHREDAGDRAGLAVTTLSQRLIDRWLPGVMEQLAHPTWPESDARDLDPALFRSWIAAGLSFPVDSFASSPGWRGRLPPSISVTSSTLRTRRGTRSCPYTVGWPPSST